MIRSERTAVLLKKLPLLYPDAKCILNWDGRPFNLLISTILSARTTDDSVNRVTPVLWKSFAGPTQLAAADQIEVERIVHPLGFFRNKAASIIKAAVRVAELGGVPGTMDELVRIPGVGRKTASVILAECFGVPAVIVDTHVGRLSGRLDLTRKNGADRIEHDLKRLIPRDRWISFSHQLGFHGRRVCMSRNPSCDECAFRGMCPRRGLG